MWYIFNKTTARKSYLKELEDKSRKYQQLYELASLPINIFCDHRVDLVAEQQAELSEQALRKNRD